MAKKPKKAKLKGMNQVILEGSTAEHMRLLLDDSICETLRSYMEMDVEIQDRNRDELFDDFLEDLAPFIKQHAIFARVLHQFFGPIPTVDIKKKFADSNSEFLRSVNFDTLWEQIENAQRPFMVETVRQLEAQRYEHKSQIDALKAMKKKYSDIVIPPKLLEKYNHVDNQLREIYSYNPELEPALSEGT